MNPASIPWWRRVLRAFLALLLALAAAVFTLSLLVAATLVVVAWTLGSWLTGRRAAPSEAWARWRHRARSAPSWARRRPAPQDVVDVQAREVKGAPPSGRPVAPASLPPR